ncbi:MAG TPA: hypothetical protein VHX38_02505 [Pseudonocardiaceae bacterium]|jgi:hypothetical protein|nr:hypothetical protein [Pseudonocardiaceae bacterium]
MNRRTEPLDPETIVGQHFPLHGPYNEDLTYAAGGTLYETVRYFNYATGQGAQTALPYASTASHLVSNIHGAVAMLDQTFRQFEQRCVDFAGDPTLYDATNRRGGHQAAVNRASSAHAALEEAQQHAARLVAALARAHSDLNALGHSDGGEA